MNHRQALKIAAECITYRMREYTVGANSFKMGARTPANERAHKEYAKLADALRIVEEEIMGQGKLF